MSVAYRLRFKFEPGKSKTTEQVVDHPFNTIWVCYLMISHCSSLLTVYVLPWTYLVFLQYDLLSSVCVF